MYHGLVNPQMRAYAKIFNITQALEAIFDTTASDAVADQEHLEDFILREMNRYPANPIYRCLQTLLREHKEIAE